MSERVVVCGSRGWRGGSPIRKRLFELPAGSTVIHGGAKGADQTAGRIAEAFGRCVITVPPNYSLHGKPASHIRNDEMLAMNPDRVIAFWDGSSPGTRSMIEKAKARGIETEVITLTHHWRGEGTR